MKYQTNRDRDKVKAERLKKGWSIARLAREAEVCDRTVARAEKGCSLSEVTQSKLAKALCKDIEYLFVHE